jgi:predicted HicB family RNase H-like nuclease
MNTKMTPQQEHDFYAQAENQTPQGAARRRSTKLTELVPVRFPPETLDRVRKAADADDRSVSSWIRRAVDHQLEQEATKTA